MLSGAILSFKRDGATNAVTQKFTQVAHNNSASQIEATAGLRDETASKKPSRRGVTRASFENRQRDT